jgi:hypothetical protein
MTRNEQEMYSNISSIAKSLEKIAKALDNKVSNELVDATTKDIPGFEGVLNDLDKLYVPKDKYETDGTSVGNGEYEDEEYDKYADDPNLEVQMNQDEGFGDYHANLGKLNNNPPLHKDEPYETDLQGIRVDSDHDIRSTAAFYEIEYMEKHFATKKECILDYVTNEFGILGARYTDIIKFAYYLGAHNAPKYSNENRGYYSLALAGGRGFLVHGGTNQLVKGINKEGKERYFALSEVDNFTNYYKRIS